MEKQMLLDLTQELLEQVLKNLSVKHIINLQCCSSTYHKMLQSYVWKTVHVKLDALSQEDFDQKRIAHLKFTKTLCLGNGYTMANIDRKIIARNYEMLLRNCNPLKLKHGPWLKACDVAKQVESICRMTNLVHLNISGMAGIDRLSFWIQHYENGYIKSICELMPQLKILKLFRIGLYDDDIAPLSKLQNLEELDLTSNEALTDMCLHSVSMVPKLKILRLRNCHLLTEQGFLHLTGSTILEKLDVESCEYRDGPIIQIGKIKSLTHLNLRYNNFTDIALKDIRKLEHLSCLKFASNNLLTDNGLKHLSSLNCLNYLLIKDMKNIHGIGFPVLRSVRTLEIYNCDITDEGAWFIAQNASLEKLNMHSNYSLSNEGYLHLCNLVELVYLNISDCDRIDDGALINGKEINIPPSLKMLKVVGVRICRNTLSYLHEKLAVTIMSGDYNFWNKSPSHNYHRGKEIVSRQEFCCNYENGYSI